MFATLISGNSGGLTFTNYDGKSKEYAKYLSSNVPIHLLYALTFSNANTVCTAVASTAGVVFGNGADAVSMDDHELSGNVISTINTTAADVSSHEVGCAEKVMIYTVTNTGSESITISEIGYYGAVGTGTTSTYALLERTLLETPITIEPGGVGQVTYTIRMNYPTV
jgi:hypothetical protein